MSDILKVLHDSADSQFAFLCKNLKREFNNGLGCSYTRPIWSILVPKYMIILCGFINFENHLWFLIFALAQKKNVYIVYQGVENICCR